MVIFILALMHNVPGKITPEDQVALEKILTNIKDTPLLSFNEEVDRIQNIQESVFWASMEATKIPLRQRREPQDLLDAGYGLCGDRGRTMEKAFRYAGFNARFVMVFTKDKKHEDSPKKPYYDPYGSHALVEVKTSKGWLIVDTVSPWISLDIHNNPVSLEMWQGVKHRESYEWEPKIHGKMYWILKQNFKIAYGVYSRHGLFYPPYTPHIPDVNIPTFIKGTFFKS